MVKVVHFMDTNSITFLYLMQSTIVQQWWGQMGACIVVFPAILRERSGLFFEGNEQLVYPWWLPDSRSTPRKQNNATGLVPFHFISERGREWFFGLLIRLVYWFYLLQLTLVEILNVLSKDVPAGWISVCCSHAEHFRLCICTEGLHTLTSVLIGITVKLEISGIPMGSC